MYYNTYAKIFFPFPFRNDHDDPQFLHLLELLDRSFRSGNSSDGNPIQDWPFLRHFPPFSAKFRELMDGRLGVDNMLEVKLLNKQI